MRVLCRPTRPEALPQKSLLRPRLVRVAVCCLSIRRPQQQFRQWFESVVVTLLSTPRCCVLRS